jgi:hypothetical protein
MNANGQKAPELVGEIIEPKTQEDIDSKNDANLDLVSEDITRLDQKAKKKKKKKKPVFNQPRSN